MSEPTTAPAPSLTLTLSLAELEQLLRRIVREELDRMRDAALDDPVEEAALVAEILAELEYEKTHPPTLIAWEDVKAELDRAEAAGELPD